MKTFKYVCFILVMLISVVPIHSGEIEYRIGGKQFEKTWEWFYVIADHEPELDDPLIKAGKPMVAAICEAVLHKDMKRRRYAIGALGYIGDKKAIPTLEKILNDTLEIDYFRGDALSSIYQLDRKLGRKYAEQYKNENKYLSMIAKAIQENKKWLIEPTSE